MTREMKHIMRIAYMALAVVALASCSSTRTATKAPMIGNLTGKAFTEKVIEQEPRWASVSAKATFRFSMEGKKDMKVNGTLRVKRGESIQLIVTPILGIEMGRMEITPEGILAMDRMNKRYAQVPFSQLGLEIGFETIQALFLNELFLPNRGSLKAADAASFTVTPDAAQALLEPDGQKGFSYRFLASATQGTLEETRIGMTGMSYQMTWKYDDFQPLGNGQFPLHMQVTGGDGTRTGTLDMTLSRPTTGGSWDARTEVSQKYKRIELGELINILNSKL